jgi:EARP and GARP complex-interacting protein 1
VRYNIFHDELLLVGGSDNRCALISAPEASSDPHRVLSSGDDELTRPKPVDENRLAQVYENHENSVYAVRWSAADPWVRPEACLVSPCSPYTSEQLFAALSYDGRVVVSQVPREEKHRIIM